MIKKLLIGRKRDYWGMMGILALFSFGLLLDNRFYLDIMITTVYFCVIAGAWNIMCGYAGQLSLGHVSFLGVGQYTSVLLFTKLGLSPWIGIFLGSFVAMLLAFLVGVLALRLKGPFFSLATIALSTILQIFAVKFSGLTGGSGGITVPFKPGFANMIFKEYQPFLLLFIILLAVVLFVTIYISRSRLGSNLVAIREDDLAAASLGINVFKNKVVALMISAFFTSMAGCLYAQYVLYIDPVNAFNVVISQKAAILSIIGGAGTIFGPIIGSVVLAPTEILLRSWLGSTYQGAYLIIYGILLIFVILVIPNGIFGTVSEYLKKKKSVELEKTFEKEVEDSL